LPKGAAAIFRLERARVHAEQPAKALVKIGEHAVGVEKQSRLRILLGHQNRAGSSSIGTGAEICSHPWLRSTSLLSRAFRPGPSDQVMWYVEPSGRSVVPSSSTTRHS